jgi:hypothetical protein
MRPYLRGFALLRSLGWDQFRSWAMDRSARWSRCHSCQRFEHPPILEFRPPLEMADEFDQRICNWLVDSASRYGSSRRHRVIGDLGVVRGRQSDCNCGIVRSEDLGATSGRHHPGENTCTLS